MKLFAVSVFSFRSTGLINNICCFNLTFKELFSDGSNADRPKLGSKSVDN